MYHFSLIIKKESIVFNACSILLGNSFHYFRKIPLLRWNFTLKFRWEAGTFDVMHTERSSFCIVNIFANGISIFWFHKLNVVLLLNDPIRLTIFYYEVSDIVIGLCCNLICPFSWWYTMSQKFLSIESPQCRLTSQQEGSSFHLCLHCNRLYSLSKLLGLVENDCYHDCFSPSKSITIMD